MFKALFNTVKISCTITPVSGFLVKADTKGANFMEPHLPMRTRHGGTETVFIPGSSIKGVVRSASERILRSFAPEKSSWLAEDPLYMNSRSHSTASDLADKIAKSYSEGYPMARVYAMQCLASRTFGSQALASRVRFADSFPSAETSTRANRVSERAGVAIDRKSGGPGRGKLYQNEVVTDGDFQVQIFAENIQLWQVGLLGLVLEDIDMGLVRFGSAKTRGLGAFRVDIQRIDYMQVGAQTQKICGVGSLVEAEFAKAYDLLPSDDMVAPQSIKPSMRAGRTTWSYTNPQDAWSFFHSTQEKPWNEIQNWIQNK